MNRLLIALLSAFDAAVAAAAGAVVVLAPLTVLWVFGLGGDAPWSALWPASATVWQLGHLVPLSITLPGDYLAATGIAQGAASFTLSLAPLAFAGFTAIFAARSGARASRAEGWITGVVAGSVVFAALAAAIALTSRNGIAAIHLWQAVVFPTLVFAVPSLVGAVAVEWSEAGSGLVARLRDRVEALPHEWGVIPGLAVRGAAAATAGLVGLGALGVVASLVVGGGQVIALFEAGHMDALGATLTTLGQLAYLPTLIVWALAFVAGPGFTLGVGGVVSPAGTQVGVVPGVPILGAVPESTSPWLLLVVLLPVAVGALAGWIARSRLVAQEQATDAASPRPTASWATAALDGLIGAPVDAPESRADAEEPIAPRLALTAAIAVLTAAAAALLAVLASGSIGPGRLSVAGPQPGPVALAVGVEVFIGAAILLLSPRRQRAGDRAGGDAADRTDGIAGGSRASAPAAVPAPSATVPSASGTAAARPATGIATGTASATAAARSATASGPDVNDTEPFDPVPLAAALRDTAPLDPPPGEPGEPPAAAPRRPKPLPPVD